MFGFFYACFFLTVLFSCYIRRPHLFSTHSSIYLCMWLTTTSVYVASKSVLAVSALTCRHNDRMRRRMELWSHCDGCYLQPHCFRPNRSERVVIILSPKKKRRKEKKDFGKSVFFFYCLNQNRNTDSEVLGVKSHSNDSTSCKYWLSCCGQWPVTIAAWLHLANSAGKMPGQSCDNEATNAFKSLGWGPLARMKRSCVQSRAQIKILLLG